MVLCPSTSVSDNASGQTSPLILPSKKLTKMRNMHRKVKDLERTPELKNNPYGKAERSLNMIKAAMRLMKEPVTKVETTFQEKSGAPQLFC